MRVAPASNTLTENRPEVPFSFKVARGAAFCAIVALLAIVALRFVHVTLNTSASMPVGLYRTWSVDRAPRPGDIVTVCAPAGAAATGAVRGYLPRGTCAALTAPLLKYVVAAGGDTVAMSKTGVTVDGKLLPNSATLPRDGAGRPMHGYSGPRTHLRADELWLYAPQARSFDSRYFGPVSSARVRLVPGRGDRARGRQGAVRPSLPVGAVPARSATTAPA